MWIALRLQPWYTSPMPTVRAAGARDLPALTAIYNHYVVHTPITFDVTPFEPAARQAWFDAHPGGRHHLLVVEDGGSLAGYASSSRWRPKPAYDRTVESSIYLRPDACGRGLGLLLYRALIDALAREDVECMVAGVALPNEASVRLHARVGFSPVGVFRRVGRKFDQLWDVAWFQRPMR
jgi:phosphinothricin acetyltransferase